MRQGKQCRLCVGYFGVFLLIAGGLPKKISRSIWHYYMWINQLFILESRECGGER